MTTNKEYRNIEGYEDAMYLVNDMTDQCTEIHELIRYGKSAELIHEEIKKIEDMLSKVKEKIKV